jgi:PKD repeat protein
MRSIHLMAATTVLLASAWACGGGGTDVGTPPVANFSQTCTGLNCTFADQSTPAGSLTWEWNFGDLTSASNTANIQNPTHTFTAAGTFTVSLKVTDGSGASNTKTSAVAVGTANQKPVASFTTNCPSTACEFTSTSSDADGTISATHWEFGEPTLPNNTADGVTVNHTYAAAGTFNVTLTVTDDKGEVGTVTQPVNVAAASACTVDGLASTCTLNITAKSKVTVTLTETDCELGGSQLDVISPVRHNVFFNGCLRTTKGTVYPLRGPNSDQSFEPGPLVLKFTPGKAGQGDPTPGPSLITVDGSFPTWTLHIDDGGAPALPRNDDIVLTVSAQQ